MSSRLLSTLVRGSMLGAVAALGLGLAAHAQPYDNDRADYDRGDQTITANEGDIVVTAPHRYQRSSHLGAPIVRISTTRVVNVRDLDLGNPSDRDELRYRVERAAYSACGELDNAWTFGMVPAEDEDSTACVNNAIRRAMDDADTQYSANY